MKFRVRRLLIGALLALSACSAVQGGRVDEQVPLIVPPAGRHAVTTLVLTEAGPAEGQHTGYFDATGAGRVSLGFLAHGPMHYAIRATCDARARVRHDDGPVATRAWVAAGAPVALRIEHV